MGADVGLPAGFALDEPQPTSGALPAGFALDAPERGVGQALGEEAIAGAHGAEREAMGLGNVLGLSHVGVPGTSNEDLQAFDKEHAGEFANNKAGKITGEALPWVAAQFLPGLDVGADTAGLAGAGLRAASAAAQGAAQGAATAPVGEQGSQAALGALTGGALSSAGGALTRGLVSKSAPAQALYDQAAKAGADDFFIPIAQGGTGVAKTAYQHALPYALGAGAQLRKQAAQWPGQFKSDVAAPLYKSTMDRWSTAGLPYRPGVGQTLDPADFEQDVLSRIHADTPDMPNATTAQVAANARAALEHNVNNPQGLTGNTLQRTYQSLGGATGRAGGPGRLANQSARDVLDDVRTAGLPGGASGADAAALSDLDNAYSGIKTVAANKIPRHNLANYSEVAAGIFHPATALPLAGALTGANLLATKTAQRGLYGDLGLQQSMHALLAAHPELGAAIRSGAIGAENAP